MYTRESAKKSVGKGWGKLIDSLYDKYDGEFELTQVKEKFGGLRIYAFSTEEVLDFISELEQESFKICENCGNPGSIRENHGWYTTLCDKCYDKTNL